MSQENVELAARVYELRSTSKAELLARMSWMMEFCHPEGRVEPTRGGLGPPGPRRGQGGA